MTDIAGTKSPYFYGIMILKDGHWTPYKKYGVDALGSALIDAEEMDKTSDFDGVKLMKVPLGGSSGEPKEIWISPHLSARSKIQSAAKVRAGIKKTKETFANIHADRKAGKR